MPRAQYIAYSYIDSGMSVDFERDIEGDEITFRRGDILFRHNKNWRIDSIRIEKDGSTGAIWVYLIEASVN